MQVRNTSYSTVVNFGHHHDVKPVTISASGFSIAGEIYSLTCSATLFEPVPLPSDAPSPNFQWFFGPSGNASLPSGMISGLNNSYSTRITYTSTMQFSPLSQSHTGNYTCHLGAASLANSTMVTVIGMIRLAAHTQYSLCRSM